MEQVRVFISINFPSETKLKLSGFVSGLRDKFSDVRWVNDESLHLTLKFLGEIPANDLDKLYLGCQNAVSHIASFSFYCEGLGMFPNEQFPRVVWLGIKKGETELKALVCKLEADLAKQGFPNERRDYKPHLTLGRIKTANNSTKKLWKDLSPYHSFCLGEIVADRICVMKSVLGSSGAEHFVLKEFKLGGNKNER
ncbi:MAG: RNA 2',3'-cyclic phosphodiesterase [bacterium]|nr:RNA 2',3'-cyclic phosphodiesterase [bacterium]